VPAAYLSDLCERVVHTVGEGTSRRGAAGVFRVSVSAAIRWTNGTMGSLPLPSVGIIGRRRSNNTGPGCWPSPARAGRATLAEIQTRLSDTHGLKKSASCQWRFFRRHDVTFRKTLHASEQDRADVKAAREAQSVPLMARRPLTAPTGC
jgi:transposase